MNVKLDTQPELSAVRQRIINTAARLFHQQGFNSTGINQLIAEAGVAKASLYQHFRTKEDILKAYLEQTSRAWFEQVQAIVDQPISVKEKILALFDLIRDFSVTVDFRGCNFQNALVEIGPGDSETHRLIRDHKMRMGQVFADLLTDARPGLADELALLFEGALLMSQLYNSLEPIQKARTVVDQIL